MRELKLSRGQEIKELLLNVGLPASTNRKKPEEDFCLYEEKQEVTTAFSVGWAENFKRNSVLVDRGGTCDSVLVTVKGTSRSYC